MAAILVICFTLSGAASLILQVVWVRKLIAVFGSSSLAISTVLATFMAGLALGSVLGGRLADRLIHSRRRGRNPLAGYGLCECLVAVSAILVIPLVGHYHGANAWLWQKLGDFPALLAMARFALTALALLIPTTAMGATLPLIVRHVTRTPSDFERLGVRLGLFYAANTLGALCGAAGAGFWLIPALGVGTTNSIAAYLAGGVGIAALAIARAVSPAALEDAIDPPERPQSTSGAHASGRQILILYALSGAVAMSLEVVWSRALAIVLGSSVYSFTLVLCVFLVGISLGSAAAARWLGAVNPTLALSRIFVAVSFGIIITHQLVDSLPEMFLAMIEGTELGVDTVLGIHTFLTGLVILPAALGLGAVMPLAIRAYAGAEKSVGRDVGRAYAANTVGAIVGAFAAGFLLLPTIGLEGSVRGAAILSGMMALATLWPSHRSRFTALASLVLIVTAVVAPGWNRSNFTAGLFRTHLARDYVQEGGLFDRNVRYYRDGIATTVTVEQFGEGWVLRNNGKVEASNRHDMPTQILVGLLPVLFHGDDDLDVFIVGYGSGVTVGSVAIAPQVESVDVVELEPAVLEAADRFFGDFNNQPQHSPKVRRLVGDGRNVLLAGDKRFDIIVSEPSNPWIAGVASLFTREFYALAKAHLEPDGVFCQWAQLYELGPRNVKMIYRTFAGSFRYVYAFTPGDETTDTVLLGSDRPLEFDVEALGNAMQASQAFKRELARAEIDGPHDLLASLLLAPTEIPSFTAGAPINSDDNALLEFSAPRDLLDSHDGSYFTRLVRGDMWPYGYLEAAGITPKRGDDAALLARALLTYGRLRQSRRWLTHARLLGASPPALRQIELLQELAAPRDFLDPEMAVTEGGPVVPKPSPALFTQRGEAGAQALNSGYELLAAGRFAAAWNAMQDLPPRADNPGGRDVTLLMAYSAYKALELKRALDLLHSVRGHELRNPALLYYLGRVHLGLGHFRDAVLSFEELVERHRALAEEVAKTRL